MIPDLSGKVSTFNIERRQFNRSPNEISVGASYARNESTAENREVSSICAARMLRNFAGCKIAK